MVEARQNTPFCEYYIRTKLDGDSTIEVLCLLYLFFDSFNRLLITEMKRMSCYHFYWPIEPLANSILQFYL